MHPMRSLRGWVPAEGDEAGVEIEESEEVNDHLKYPAVYIGRVAVV